MRVVGRLLLLLSTLGGCSPRTVDWSRHDAFRQCSAAIAAWPASTPPCQALHMCANEAQLSTAEQRTLAQMIASLPGCAAP